MEKKIFDYAQNDSIIANVYEDLLQLRSLFDSIVKTVQDKGNFTTMIRNLDQQIDDMSKRNSENNMEQANKDLSMIKKENMQLIKEIKKKKALLQEEESES